MFPIPSVPAPTATSAPLPKGSCGPGSNEQICVVGTTLIAVTDLPASEQAAISSARANPTPKVCPGGCRSVGVGCICDGDGDGAPPQTVPINSGGSDGGLGVCDLNPIIGFFCGVGGF